MNKENIELKAVCSDLQAENKAISHVLELKDKALSKTQTVQQPTLLGLA